METKTFQARHEQVANWLRQQIKSGKFKINAQLPSESELCRQFEVSRVTVRHALRTLETENMISRRQGVGSFVKPQPMRHPLMKVTDFAEDMAQAGLTASSLVLRFETDQPPAKIRELLGVPEGQLTIRLDRLFEVAESAGVAWLMFDREAAVIDGLPVFDSAEPGP